MKTISVEALHEKMLKNELVNLLDVRSVEEHEDNNIGGNSYPISRIKKMDIAAIEHLKNEEVICYCRNGEKTSNDACLMLEYMGFTNVVQLQGGVRKWEQAFGDDE